VCKYCNYPIEGKYKAIKIDEASDQKLYFHETCIKCADCGVDLGNKIFIREGEKSKLFCEAHRKVQLKRQVSKHLRQLPICPTCANGDRHYEYTCPKGKSAVAKKDPPSAASPAINNTISNGAGSNSTTASAPASVGTPSPTNVDPPPKSSATREDTKATVLPHVAVASPVPDEDVKEKKSEVNDSIRSRLSVCNIQTSNSVRYAKVLSTFLDDEDLNTLAMSPTKAPETRSRIAASFDNLYTKWDPVTKQLIPQSREVEAVSSHTNTTAGKAEFKKVDRGVVELKGDKSTMGVTKASDGGKGGYVKEGFLTKSGKNGKDWKKRWCCLSSDELYYFDSKAASKPNGSVNLKGAMVRPTKDTSVVQAPLPFNFQIVDRSLRVWTFCAENDSEMISWFETIAEVVGLPREILLENLANIQPKSNKLKNVDVKPPTPTLTPPPPPPPPAVLPAGLGVPERASTRTPPPSDAIVREGGIKSCGVDLKQPFMPVYAVISPLKMVYTAGTGSRPSSPSASTATIELTGSSFSLGPYDLGTKYVFNIKAQSGTVHYFACDDEGHLFALKDAFTKARKARGE
jgi:hypothetical protein